MDTGNFKLTYEEYKTRCLSMGLKAEWEIKLSYAVYLAYMDNDEKRASLILYYNQLYFREGAFN